MYKISLSDMQILLLAAKYKNFSKAAQILYISQPMVTKCIKRLEKELGVQLFQRTSRSVELTYAGDVLTKRWKTLLAELEASVRDAQEVSASGLSLLRIGALEGYGFEDFLPRYLLPFEQLHHKVRIEFSLYNLHEIREQLENLDVIFADNLEYEAEKDHAFLRLDTLPVCLAVSREHPFAHKRGITRKELEGERLLVLSPRLSPATMSWTARAFEGMNPPAFIPVENTASQLMRVCCNQGAAILFPSMVRGYERQLALLPIRDFPLEAYRLAMYRPQKVSTVTRKFLEYLAGAFAKDGE